MDFQGLLNIMEKLRGDGGCPWDKEQTRESLKPFILEEAYELIEAIESGDPEKMKEELGDLLFQIVFQCQVPEALPSLLRAHRLQNRAASVGFDWNKVDDALKKLDEEVKEFKKALETKEKNEIGEELGDILFMLVNVSRFIGVNPEDALRKTITKFISRFRYIEMKAADNGRKLSDMTLSEMDKLWEEAKNHE